MARLTPSEALLSSFVRIPFLILMLAMVKTVVETDDFLCLRYILKIKEFFFYMLGTGNPDYSVAGIPVCLTVDSETVALYDTTLFAIMFF